MNEPVLCDDKVSLVEYLYGEGDEASRRQVEAHLAICASCASELAGLQGVRGALASWVPPEQELGFQIVQGPQAAIRQRRSFSIPYWAQVAAAVLVLSVAAAIANLEVRFGDGGVVVRTGWQQAQPASTPVAPVTSVPVSGDTAPWQADLAAFKQEIRQELAAAATAPPGPRAASVSAKLSPEEEARLVRRIHGVFEPKLEQVRGEFAGQVVNLARDFQAQRRADLRFISDGFGQIERGVGTEVLRNRQMLDYLQRVSQAPGGQPPVIK